MIESRLKAWNLSRDKVQIEGSLADAGRMAGGAVSQLAQTVERQHLPSECNLLMSTCPGGYTNSCSQSQNLVGEQVSKNAFVVLFPCCPCHVLAVFHMTFHPYLLVQEDKLAAILQLPT